MNLTINENVVLTGFKNQALTEATDIIVMNVRGLVNNIYSIAVQLDKIDSEKLYEDDGYKSVIDYAEHVFDLKKTVVYSLIKVGRKYTNKDLLCSNLPHDDKDFTPHQIVKMLPLGDDVVSYVESGELSPDMSCREIEKFVKEVKADKKASENESDEQGADEQGENTGANADTERESSEDEITFEMAEQMLRHALDIINSMRDTQFASEREYKKFMRDIVSEYTK